MSRPLSIAIFHMGFFFSGGGEKLVLLEALELRRRGHDVRVYAPIVDREHCLPDLLERSPATSLLPRVPNVFGVGHAIALLWSSLFAGRLVRGIDADVYLGANQPGAWLARIAARRHGKRYVVYLNQPNRLLAARGIDLETRHVVVKRDFFVLDAVASFGRPVLNALDRSSTRDAAVRLGDGAYVTGQLRSHYGGEWRSCPAAAEVPHRPPTSDREDDPLGYPYLLLTNRHYPQKRFELMFPVIERVRRDRPVMRLVITGQETIYTDRLRAEVARRGLSDAVRFLGLVTEAELARLYRGATVYVYPSPEEDFGMGIVEAMAHGTPAVAWDNAGPTGIIQDGRSGRLIPLGDVRAFGEAVAELVRDEGLRRRIGSGGWERASELFSLTAHGDVLEQALRDAAAR